MKNDLVYISDMLKCMEKIGTYTASGKNHLLSSSLHQDAVIRNLENLGDAAKHLSENLKHNYPDIPWRKIAGLRDVLIHNYMGVDLIQLWNIVANDLDPLHKQLQRIADNLSKST